MSLRNSGRGTLVSPRNLDLGTTLSFCSYGLIPSCIPAKMTLQGKDWVIVIKLFVIFQEGGLGGGHADPLSPLPPGWLSREIS